MKKYKYLFKNVGLLTISNFGSKILSFLLVPLYTSLLTTGEYGTYDLYVTTASLMAPVLTLNIVDSVMRFSLDENSKKNEVFTVGFRDVLRAGVVFVVLVAVNYGFGIIDIFNQYPLYFILYFILSVFYDLLSQFSRGMERILDLAIAGIINSVSLLSFNILFLSVLKMGLSGYFLANCIGFAIPVIYLAIRLKIWNKVVFKFKNKLLKKEMEKYSTPMVFNTISWWINNVSDRYVVTWLCGVADNGVYSVAYKIPSILNVLQNIFSQAWTLSAVKEFNDEGAKFYSDVYKIYNVGMVMVCSVLIAADRIIAKILFANEFFGAWEYAPFLMISVVFGALSALLGGIFSAALNSKAYAKTTVLGAVINTALNIVLVWKMGPIGAAIATMISYIIVWIARIIESRKIIKVKINFKKDCFSYLLLILQSVFLICIENTVLRYIVQVAFLIVVFLVNIKEVVFFSKKVLNKIAKRRETKTGV